MLLTIAVTLWLLTIAVTLWLLTAFAPIIVGLWMFYRDKQRNRPKK